MTHYLTLKFSVRKEFYQAANTAVAIRLMDGKQVIMTQQQIIASQQHLRQQPAIRVPMRNQSVVTTVLALKQAQIASLVPAWTTGPETTAPSLTLANQVHAKMTVSAPMSIIFLNAPV